MSLRDPIARKAYLAGYYLLHKEQIKARSSEWAKKNPGKANARARKWALAHPERVKQIRNAYSRTPHNRNRVRRHKLFRRTIEQISHEELIKIQSWEAQWKQMESVQCYWCRKQVHPKLCHTDHVMPLSLYGKHELSNVVISCAPCNFRKGRQHPTDWVIKLNLEIGREIDILWC